MEKNKVVEAVIDCAYKVRGKLGPGFMEAVYSYDNRVAQAWSEI